MHFALVGELVVCLHQVCPSKAMPSLSFHYSQKLWKSTSLHGLDSVKTWQRISIIPEWYAYSCLFLLLWKRICCCTMMLFVMESGLMFNNLWCHHILNIIKKKCKECKVSSSKMKSICKYVVSDAWIRKKWWKENLLWRFCCGLLRCSYYHIYYCNKPFEDVHVFFVLCEEFIV